MSTSTFSQNKNKPKPKYQLKYLIGAIVIVAVIGYLIFFGLTQTSQWAINVTDLHAKGSSAIGQGVRVSGQLEANSVEKDIKAHKIAFGLTDGTNRLPVSYNGIVPDTFDRAVEEVAADLRHAVGQTAEAIDTVPLLVARAEALAVDAPALHALAAVLEGQVEPGAWRTALTVPTKAA